MDGTATRHEADEILAELPDRISDVVKPFARHSPDHPALVQGDVTWTYAALAAGVADTAVILKLYDIRPGDRVFFEPGEEHWHGAAPDRFMTHLALLDVDDDGNSATWGEHVTDEEYNAV